MQARRNQAKCFISGLLIELDCLLSPAWRSALRDITGLEVGLRDITGQEVGLRARGTLEDPERTTYIIQLNK